MFGVWLAFVLSWLITVYCLRTFFSLSLSLSPSPEATQIQGHFKQALLPPSPPPLRYVYVPSLLSQEDFFSRAFLVSPTAIRVRAFTFIARRLQPSFSCVVDVVVAVVVASHQICQWVRNNDVYFAVFVIVRCIFLLAGKQLVPDISQASCITPLACAICAEEREAGATMEVHCFFIRGFLNLGSLRPLPPQQKTRGKKRF